MSNLANRRVLLGVTGSIAAYKSPDLVRRLREAGADVQVVATQGGLAFITELTLQAVSGRRVRGELLDPEAEAAMGHIELARWADLILIAPASADFIARLSLGRADDLLAAVCLASKAPLAVAPAMNRVMWADTATQANIERLKQRACRVLGPGQGAQACGESGEGRMLEPLEIAAACESLFDSGALSGLSVLVTAGPTREAIDPVRYISNRSSGKMGFALARAAVEAGARVTLVSGPVSLPTPERVTRVDVESAEQMRQAVEANLGHTDILIAAAAVADFRPKLAVGQKIDKRQTDLNLALEATTDILAQVGARQRRPFLVGFAAQTENVAEKARQKLNNKRLDMIAANRVGVDDQGRAFGFDSDENELQVLWEDGGELLGAGPKLRLARDLLALIAKNYYDKQNAAEDSR